MWWPARAARSPWGQHVGQTEQWTDCSGQIHVDLLSELNKKLHIYRPPVPSVEAVEVGGADPTHLGCVVGLQGRKQRLADVEVSVLQFALYQLFYQLARLEKSKHSFGLN